MMGDWLWLFRYQPDPDSHLLMLPELTLRVRERKERRGVCGVLEGILTMMVLKVLEKARMKSTDDATLKIQFLRNKQNSQAPFQVFLGSGGRK